MNYKRAIWFGIMLYLSSFVVYGAYALLGMAPDSYEISFKAYLVNWILYIPIVLLLAKWFFKQVEPSPKRGLELGVVAILVAFVADGLGVVATLAAGQSLEAFIQLYADWKFYFTVMWVVLLTVFAGWEFDRTFTRREVKSGTEEKK